MLANKPKEAISSYQKSISEQKNDYGFNNYSIARLYAKNGNSVKAWKYLNQAANAGFGFSYVLLNDSYLDSLRKTAKWKSFIDGLRFKRYTNN
ncbi:MAG: TPR end-of-group domain-containing protein, partial [Ferruginibacter sp.]